MFYISGMSDAVPTCGTACEFRCGWSGLRRDTFLQEMYEHHMQLRQYIYTHIYSTYSFIIASTDIKTHEIVTRKVFSSRVTAQGCAPEPAPFIALVHGQ